MDKPKLDKSFEERSLDFLNIFSGISVSATQLQQFWGNILQSSLDSFGWQGIWKIPFEDCQAKGFFYPTSALVFVDAIDFTKLTASIRIIDIRTSSCNYCEKFEPTDILQANLIDLWPTDKQDSTLCINLEQCKASIDNVRFFFKNLWRNWDPLDDDKHVDWVKKHLEPRLQLYFDIEKKVIPPKISFYYLSHLKEVNEKYGKLKTVYCQINNGSDDDDDDNDDDDEQKHMDLLCALHTEITKLKSKLALFENPIMRQRRLQLEKNDQDNNSTRSPYWLVFDSDKSWEQYINFVNKVETFNEIGTTFNTATTLQQALDEAKENDTIFIGRGLHTLGVVGNFPVGGGTIFNVDAPEVAIVETTNEHVLLEVAPGATITLKNINFRMNNARYGFQVHEGASLKMSNCSITCFTTKNTKRSLIQRAIAVNNSILHMENCQISQVKTGITVKNKKAEMELKKCTLENIALAIKVDQTIKINIENTEFKKCKQVLYIATLDNEAEVFAGLDSLEGEASVTFIGNKLINCDVPVILSQKKIEYTPISDVLSNPTFNTTLG